MKKLKYIMCSLIAGSFMACENETLDDLRDRIAQEEVVLEEFTSGEADFSTFVSLGNSLTAGFTDNALFIAGQENSLPNMLATAFETDFNQPLMSDNIGGMTFGGARILEPRLVFNGSTPAPLESLIGDVMPSTDVTNLLSGPFNNMGVPGARSFHLLFDGYGSLANLATATANPYFVRMASSQSATMLGDALAQSPTFMSLWIGNNDVLGYATSGGDQTLDAITPETTFNGAIQAIFASIPADTKAVVANIPDVTTIPFFTTVPYNPVPLDAATATAVNSAYAAYNGGLQIALMNGLLSEEEATARAINFEASETNPVVIEDENLTNLAALGLPSIRQATQSDLLVLTASSFIGTEAVEGNPLSINGVAVPLGDRWVLTPTEQAEIRTATTSFNATIEAAATAAGYAFVDANALLTQLASGGITEGDYSLTSSLVTGGGFSLDGVHPTARGYALLANNFLRAIDSTYNSNFEASGKLLDLGNFPTNYSPTLQ